MRRGAPAIQGVAVGQLALAMLLGMAIATTGCQAAPVEEAAESLQVRAQKYLELKQKRDWVAIYDGLLDPELHTKLKRLLGTQVRIRVGRSGGSIDISFASPADLDRVFSVIMRKTDIGSSPSNAD